MDGFFLTYTLNTAFLIAVMIIVITMCARSYALSAARRRCFMTCFSMIILAGLSEWMGVFLNGKEGVFLRCVHSAFKFLEFSLAPFVPVIMCFDETTAHQRAKRIILISVIANALIEFVSMFTGIIFYVDAAGVYHHGPVYFLYYVLVLGGIAYLFYESYRLSRRNQNWRMGSLYAIVVLLVLGVVPHLVKTELRYDWLAAGMSCLLYYVYYSETTIIMDPVTHIFNRRCYDKALEKLRQGTVVVNFDIDGFKKINDRYGHLYGDVTLEAVAEIIRQSYGKYGACYRVGGDEFGALITRPHPCMDEVNSVFDNLLDAKRKSDSRFPWVSHGYCLFNGDMDELRETLANADTMMYKYKEINKDKP